MIKYIFFILFFLISLTLKVNAACDDPPEDGVIYTGCAFADSQDLSSSYLPNADMTFVSFIGVIFNKSIMLNSRMDNSQFPESSWVRSNLYESSMQNSNFEDSDFTSANLHKVSFRGSSLLNVNFSKALMTEVDLTGANIQGAVFDQTLLGNAIFPDGTKCAVDSVGECKKMK